MSTSDLMITCNEIYKDNQIYNETPEVLQLGNTILQVVKFTRHQNLFNLNKKVCYEPPESLKIANFTVAHENT